MRAMIFAAGLGTRLRPLTDNCPKALVELDGKPLLFHCIENLKRFGVTEFVVNVHHFGEQIIDYLQANDFGVKIKVSDERDFLLDTGGGLKRASALFEGEEPIIVHNVDIFSDADIRMLYDAHLASKADATLLCSHRDSSRQLVSSEDGRLRAWKNLKTDETKGDATVFGEPNNQLAFAGIHIITPSLLREMSGYPDKFSIIDFYLDMATSHDIQLYESADLQMIDVGKVDALAKAGEFIKKHINH
ncbi:MAG: nucleotidyltransferase family protein [Paludibacteraceae bacterium]|nr:nucleotidyltransferase family protein [Paludibacteraceae bacterium]